jgi:hypothetical protein
LVACGKKEKAPEIDIKGPATGPDVTKVTPDYGPNDPVPVEDSVEDPTEDPIENSIE